jgi:DNA polymerase-3 subunit epsilon
MKRWFTRVRADDHRWVVLDVEASGLDASRDRLLAIAAVALHHDRRTPRIALGDSFECVLRHESAAVDKANILVHGIGVGEQRGGCDAAEALAAFERWAGQAPLLGFHVAFDAALIQRDMRRRLARSLDNPWIDIAGVAPMVRPDLAARSLDDWLAAYGVPCLQRHQAAADAFATAELLLRLWPAVLAQRAGADWRALQQLAAQRRWLPP